MNTPKENGLIAEAKKLGVAFLKRGIQPSLNGRYGHLVNGLRLHDIIDLLKFRCFNDEALETKLHKFFNVIDNQPQSKLDLDEACDRCDIDTSELAGIIQETLFKFGLDVMLDAEAELLPLIHRVALANALIDKDERKQWMQTKGYWLAPRSSISITNTVSATAIAASNSEAGEGLPSFEDDVIEIDECVKDNIKLLPPVPINTVIDSPAGILTQTMPLPPPGAVGSIEETIDVPPSHSKT